MATRWLRSDDLVDHNSDFASSRFCLRPFTPSFAANWAIVISLLQATSFAERARKTA